MIKAIIRVAAVIVASTMIAGLTSGILSSSYVERKFKKSADCTK